jgi:hypothetical protein
LGAGSAQAATRGYGTVDMALEIDGTNAGQLTGASGGGAVPQMSGEATSSTRRPQNELVGISQEPVTIYFTSGLEARALDWFNGWTQQPRNVAIVMYERTTFNEVYRLTMTNARVTGFILPVLNSASADAIEFSVTLLAEHTHHEFANGKSKVVPVKAPKNVRVNAFRFFIDKLEQATQYTRSIEGIAVKQVTSASATGGFESAKNRGTSVIQYPSFEVSFSLNGAAAIHLWFTEMLNNRRAPRQGQLQLQGTTPKGFATVAMVDFVGLQPIKASAPFDGSGEDGIAAVKVVLLPEEVRLNLKSLA